MLTAKDSEIDKVAGLEIGADDYVTKPYPSGELLAGSRRRCDASPSQRNSCHSSWRSVGPHGRRATPCVIWPWSRQARSRSVRRPRERVAARLGVVYGFG